MHALTFTSFGSTEVLQYTIVPQPVIRENEILVQTKAIGLNYADIDYIEGKNPPYNLPPYIPGFEGAGIVVESNNHHEFRIGDRVGFVGVPYANAEFVAVDIDHAIPLPDTISFETAASLLLQGLTAHYLATDSHKTSSGETIVIHSVAGGVGQLLTQISKHLGAKVIGLTSSPDKALIALNQGADVVHLYSENWKDKILQENPNGIEAVYDCKGTTLQDSFAITKTGGQVVLFGNTGGNPTHIDPISLMQSSKTLTGFDFLSLVNSKEQRIKRSHNLFKWLNEGKIMISIPVKFKLSEGKQAHEFMQNRKSTGKIILIP